MSVCVLDGWPPMSIAHLCDGSRGVIMETFWEWDPRTQAGKLGVKECA